MTWTRCETQTHSELLHNLRCGEKNRFGEDGSWSSGDSWRGFRVDETVATIDRGGGSGRKDTESSELFVNEELSF